ncbi:DUF6445 family protein [Pseudoalteromonas byunsanensis]
MIKHIPIKNCDASVYIIDDFLLNPELLVNFAKQKAYFLPPGKDGTLYPGIRDQLPKPYERALAQLINEHLFTNYDIFVHRCLLSLVTLNAEQLSNMQKLPHIDSLDKNEYASVHYLCDEKYGGTSIYQYKPESVIEVTEDNCHIIHEMINHVQNSEKNSGYLNGKTSIFEPIITIEAKMNRLVLYPSNLLHCANIDPRYSISANPSEGRLTVASFFRLDNTNTQ